MADAAVWRGLKLCRTEEKSTVLTVSENTGTDKNMSPRNFFGDAMTAVSINIISNITGLITYFYTDIIGLAAGTVGTVLLLSKLVDSFTDIGMGVLVDRTKSRFGKARPWLLRMAIPSLLCIVLLFTVPVGISTGYKSVYVLVTNMLVLAVVYTAISVSSGSLLSLETKDTHERSKMGIFRLIFAYAAGMSVSSLLLPTANRLGGGQRAWVIIGAVYGVISAASLVAAFFCVGENNSVQPQKKEKISPLKGMFFLLKNRYWLIALAVNVFIQMIFAMIASETYYMKYIFGNENLVAVAGLFRLIFVVAGFVLTGLLIRRLGKRNIVLTGVAVSIAGYAMRAANPSSLPLNLAAIGIASLGCVPVLAVIGAMVADTIEYGEWKTGVRTVGLASSAHSFAGKMGSAFFAGTAGWLLGMSGYDGTIPVQPPAAVNVIKIINIHIPLVCYCLIFVLMLFYGLDKDYGRIMADLEERRGKHTSACGEVNR